MNDAQVCKYTQVIGDGGSNIFSIRHNLGTRAVVFTPVQAESPFEAVPLTHYGWEATSENELKVFFYFTPAVDSIKVVVVG